MEYKGYYYLKLKENFFDTNELKVLEGMENGYLYSNILLKLYLKALQNNGKLTFNEYIPYDAKMLATITGHNIDVVEKAIKIFEAMHLIEILDNGTIYMLDMQKMIGSISSEGVRKQEYRERINAEKNHDGTMLGQCPDIISISSSNINNNNSLERKVETKEIKNKENKEIEKHRYGEYNNVLLTDKEVEKLKTDYGEDLALKAIDFMDEYIEMKGYKAKSHYLAIRKWVFDAMKEENIKKERINAKTPKKQVMERSYSKEELDSFYTNIDDIKL